MREPFLSSMLSRFIGAWVGYNIGEIIRMNNLLRSKRNSSSTNGCVSEKKGVKKQGENNSPVFV